MKTDDYITLLSKALKAGEAISRRLPVHKNNKKEMYLTLLDIRIENLVQSVLCLYNANLFSPIGILFRSVVEANLDFENLLLDDNFMKDLDYRYFSEWERIFDSSKKGNPFLAGLLSSKETSPMVDLITREYDRLRNSGYRALSVKEKFDKVAQSSVYFSVYNISCCDSHNNLRALFNWNATVNGDGSYSINYSSENRNELIPILDSTTAIFINSTIKIADYFKLEVDSGLTSLSQELEKIRVAA